MMPTHESVVRVISECAVNGWQFKENTVCGNADIAHARNILLGRFLDSDCTDLFFLDADISFGHGIFTNLFTHDADVVAGIYRWRTDDNPIYPVLWVEPINIWENPNTPGLGLVEAVGVPAGMLRLSRRCVEKMAATYNERYFYDKQHNIRCPWLFEFTWEGKVRQPEDYSFCRDWRALGEKIWVDATLNIDHNGLKTFPGRLLESLIKETGYHEQVTPEWLLNRAKALI
jgi:hypothetical protein